VLGTFVVYMSKDILFFVFMMVKMSKDCAEAVGKADNA
jgi:hypothetical protein